MKQFWWSGATVTVCLVVVAAVLVLLALMFRVSA